MVWIPIAAWLAAFVVAAVMLGYCGYEIAWKTRRLRADLGALQSVQEQLAAIALRLAQARERLTAAQALASSGTR